jgi:hypothetical protein
MDPENVTPLTALIGGRISPKNYTLQVNQPSRSA